jgi:hypothetical protein
MKPYTTEGRDYRLPLCSGAGHALLPTRNAAGMRATLQRSDPYGARALKAGPVSAGLRLSFYGTLDALQRRASFPIWRTAACPCCGERTKTRRVLNPHMRERLERLRQRHADHLPVIRSPLP